MLDQLITQYGMTYYLATSVITFILVALKPSPMGFLDNAIGSFFCGFLVGWLIWPVALYCLLDSYNSVDVPFKSVNRKV